MTRTPAARGVLSGDEVRIDATAPFGLFSRTMVELVDRELVVLPALATMDSIPASTGGDRATTRATGSDAGGVREWRSGDQVRHVQWRSTARTGRLTVAERDHVAPGALVLLIAGRSGDPASGRRHLEGRDGRQCGAAARRGSTRRGRGRRMRASSNAGVASRVARACGGSRAARRRGAAPRNALRSGRREGAGRGEPDGVKCVGSGGRTCSGARRSHGCRPDSRRGRGHAARARA